MEKTEVKNRNRERALKAWETMRERGFHKFEDRDEEQKYNNPKKNKIREKIKGLIKKYGGKNILTLETRNFMLPNMMKKHVFHISEENKEEYINMLDNKPDNVFLYYGGISQMCQLVKDFDVVYLDFCCGYNSALKTINKLREKIDSARLIGFTFCLRKNKKELLDDYTLDLIFKLQQFLGSEYFPVYKTSYADTSPMATLFFAKKNQENKNKELTTEEIGKTWDKEAKEYRKITRWTIKKINEIYPHIVTPSQIFSRGAKTHLIKNKYGEIIVKRLFLLAMKEKVLSYPLGFIRYSYDKWYRQYHTSEDIDGMYEYFKQILFHNIFPIWREYDREWGCWSIDWDRFSDDGDDLFLIGNGVKKEKCFLCSEEKSSFRYKDKVFCISCFLRYIRSQGIFDFRSYKQKTIVSGKFGYCPRYSYGEYYNGPDSCKLCKNTICKNGEEMEKEIIEFNDNSYCTECFNSLIKPKLNIIEKIREDYGIECEKKVIEIYKLKKEESEK